MSATLGWKSAAALMRLSRSYRRILLNAWLGQCQGKVRGIVLDVGGEKKSQVAYAFPAAQGVHRWIYLNLDPTKAPEVVADGEHIPVAGSSVDSVICMETMEHVGDPRQVALEFGRVLRPGGTLILSMPFMYRIHSRPWDFWRFTEHGVRRLVAEAGLEVMQLEPLGRLFTVLCDMTKQAISEARPAILRWCLGVLFLPWAAVLVGLESRGLGKRSPTWSSFATGYAVLAVKPGGKEYDEHSLA